MKKKLFYGLFLILGITLLSGCKLSFNRKEPEEKIEPVTITAEEMATMKKVSEVVFLKEKTDLKVEDLTEEEKAEIARNLPEKGYMESTGTEMTTLFKKYFGQEQTVKFDNIKCFMDHYSEDANIMLIFDTEKDQYVYNENHPGHGGGGVGFYGTKMGYEKVEANTKEYKYDAKVLFYGEGMCHDIGPCEYGSAYKSYEEAIKGQNALIDIDHSAYTQEDPYSGLPVVDMDKLFEDYKSQLDTYRFIFQKEGENLVFKSYKKVA